MIKDFIPNIILKLRRDNFYKGNFSLWEKALNKSSGYDSEVIVKKVSNSLLKVKNGEAKYERDSVLYDKIEYTWTLLSFLMWVSRKKDQEEFNIVDFGGGLGTSYYQNKNFLKDFILTWNIIEQESFVKYGEKYFQSECLKFYLSLERFFRESSSNIILLCGVLQYLKFPYELLTEIFKYNFKYIYIDRTFFSKKKERITIQKVPSCIYKASYPCWIFNEKEMLTFFKKNGYKLIVDFSEELGIKVKSKGFYFIKSQTNDF